MSNVSVLPQIEWQFMLGRDEQMQSGFVDFRNFAQEFGFASKETIL